MLADASSVLMACSTPPRVGQKSPLDVDLLAGQDVGALVLERATPLLLKAVVQLPGGKGLDVDEWEHHILARKILVWWSSAGVRRTPRLSS